MVRKKGAKRGQGTVYTRSDGRHVAEITIDGKRRQFYGKTESEALEKMQQAILEHKQGLLVQSSKQKLGDYLHQWLEDVHKPTIRLSTYEKYRLALDQHIIPALGHIQLQKLTPDQVQAFYAQKLREQLSPSTIHVFHGMLHKALDNAVRWGRISRNVCDAVSLPRKQKHEIHPLTYEQAQRLLEMAQGHRLEALLTIALLTGMRRGEILALKWQDINFETGSLSIQRSVNHLAGYGYVEEEPKTAKGKRTIMLPQIALDVLKHHRARQQEARSKAGPAWQEHDLVFCNHWGGFFHFVQLFELFHRLLKDAGLPHMRFHDLRHSAATILLSMGIHPKVVQERLGHSQISVTMDIYSHVLPSMQKEVTEKLDALFRRDDQTDTKRG